MGVIDYKTPRLGEPGGKPSVVDNCARKAVGLTPHTEASLRAEA